MNKKIHPTATPVLERDVIAKAIRNLKYGRYWLQYERASIRKCCSCHRTQCVSNHNNNFLQYWN